MTVSSSIAKSGPYAGAGTTGPFTVGFRFLANSHLQVVRTDANGTDTVLSLDTDYSVTGAGSATGTLTLVSALAVGWKLTIIRSVPATQEADYVQNDAFPAESHETALDKLTMLVQQNGEAIDRSIKVGVADIPLQPLPGPTSRANTVIGFDATGNVTTLPLPSSLGAGDRIPYTLTAGIDFIAGVSTTVTLTRPPGAPGNLEVNFDGVPQEFGEWSVAGQTLTFAQPIPSFVTEVWGYIGTTLSTQIPPISSVDDPKVVTPGTPQDGVKASKLAFLQSGVGAIWRTVQAKLQDLTSAKDFGAVLDGVTNDVSAIQTYFAAYNHLVIPSGVCRISSNLTIPAGKTLSLDAGASFSIDSGVTLTINGVVQAGRYRIFSGAGTVLGIRHVYPEWWGATRNTPAFDSQPAFQAAVNCVQASSGSDGDACWVDIGPGEYHFASTLTLTPVSNVNLRFLGQGSVFSTRLTAKSGFMPNTLLSIKGSTGGTDQIASYDIGNFSVSASQADNVAIGIAVGSSGINEKLSGVQMNNIHDVMVENFTITWQVQQARLVKFSRCSGWPNPTMTGTVGVLVTLATSSFTGDIEFESCQFVAPSATVGFNVQLKHAITNTIAGVGEIKGVKFRSCTFYTGLQSINLDVSNGGAIGDVWFTDCQCDGVMGDGVSITATGANSLIDDVHFTNQYIRGFNGKAWQFLGVTSGILRHIHVLGGWTANGGRALETSGTVQDFKFNHVSLLELSFGGPLMEIVSGATDFDVSHNCLTKVGGASATTLVNLNLGTSGMVVVGNRAVTGSITGSTVTDSSGAVTKYIAGNI